MKVNMEKLVETQRLQDRLLRAVRNYLVVEDITVGRPNDNYIVRFRGQFIADSDEAYRQLEPVFQQAGTTLLFRKDGSSHSIIAVPGVIKAQPSNAVVNLVLLGVTILTVLMAGLEDTSLIDSQGWVIGLIRSLPQGIPFAVSLLAILLAHEFGHYLAARYHKTPVTLPYFIPFPGGILGTMGAFIRLKAPPRNKRVLLDIGLAGPLAGLVVAIPVLILGLMLSDVGPLPSAPPGLNDGYGITIEGNSILYLAAKYLVKGELLPKPLSYGGLNPVIYWIRYFFIGSPVPFGGRDVLLHPIAWAGWAGLLVTALNLIPAGQLDGGHVLFVLFGRRASKLWPGIVLVLLGLGFIWTGWFIWAALIFFLGRTYAQPLDDVTELDPRRRLLAIFGLIVFVLVFIPVPLSTFFG
jgi:membrane-associated protease RseP (regulator of RpoE activity)